MEAKFSKSVNNVFTYSREEALRLNHDTLGIEHLVLGMVRENTGLALKVLKSLDVDPVVLRKNIEYGIKDIVMVDSRGTIHKGRTDLNPTKEMLTNITNTACVLDPTSKECITGGLADAVKNRDIFIGVSVAGALTAQMVETQRF